MDVNKSLSEQCKRQLQTTPFGWLLNLHCNIEASGRMLEVMLASWNVDERAFQVGDRLIPFTLYDVALILGLPVRGEPIDCNQSHSGGSLVEKLLNTHLKTTSPERTKLVTLLTKPSIKVPDRVRANLGRYAWGKAVYEFLVSGLNRAAASKQAKKTRGNLHIQGCTALLQIWACEHLGIGQKNAEINQPFPRFLAWTHQRMFSKKAMEAFSNSANRCHGSNRNLWYKKPWRPCKKPMDSSHTAILRNDGAGPSNTTQTPSNQWQLELQAERTEREALARHVKRLEDEFHHVKGEAAAATVDLVSSPSKGATSVRYTRVVKTRAQKNVMIVPPESEPVRNEWVDAHFLYQPTAHDEAVLADLRKKWSFATRRPLGEGCNNYFLSIIGVDSNEVSFSTETYEITGRDVSSLLGDQAQEESSRWISTTTTILGLQLSQLQHEEAKEQKRVKNPLRMISLNQNLCSALVGYA
uniref:Aminotransferase-like plant mobile domain-containing protein n=1 Tax=Fagus sylvatica TaxID=28930 RepID=A0A2N9F470_FAGSY